MARFSVIGPIKIHTGILTGKIIPFRSKPRIIKFIAICNLDIPILICIINIVIDGFQVQTFLVIRPWQVLDCTVFHG